jgi:hypothetical protein
MANRPPDRASYGSHLPSGIQYLANLAEHNRTTLRQHRREDFPSKKASAPQQPPRDPNNPDGPIGGQPAKKPKGPKPKGPKTNAPSVFPYPRVR